METARTEDSTVARAATHLLNLLYLSDLKFAMADSYALVQMGDDVVTFIFDSKTGALRDIGQRYESVPLEYVQRLLGHLGHSGERNG